MQLPQMLRPQRGRTPRPIRLSPLIRRTSYPDQNGNRQGDGNGRDGVRLRQNCQRDNGTAYQDIDRGAGLRYVQAHVSFVLPNTGSGVEKRPGAEERADVTVWRHSEALAVNMPARLPRSVPFQMIYIHASGPRGADRTESWHHPHPHPPLLFPSICIRPRSGRPVCFFFP